MSIITRPERSAALRTLDQEVQSLRSRLIEVFDLTGALFAYKVKFREDLALLQRNQQFRDRLGVDMCLCGLRSCLRVRVRHLSIPINKNLLPSDQMMFAALDERNVK